MRNEPYVPYQKNGEWWYDDARGFHKGPFISEQACANRADVMREIWEETAE